MDENGQNSFIVDEVSVIMKESVDSILSNQSYHHNKVAQWNANIVEQILKKLTSLNKPFKYIVNC
jgi:dynein light chain Tctex-type 1